MADKGRDPHIAALEAIYALLKNLIHQGARRLFRQLSPFSTLIHRRLRNHLPSLPSPTSGIQQPPRGQSVWLN